jgi:two-component system cell cycle sensor histidine kinase/response regulator CckA
VPLRLTAFLICLSIAASFVAHAAPLRVGIDIDGEPMTFVNAQGVPAGFAVEIMNGVAREMGFEVTYVAKPWSDMFEDFKAGRLDALANVTYTNERATFIDFSAPHIVMGGAIFVRKGDTSIKSPIDLGSHRIAVKPGSAPDEYLAVHGWAGHVLPLGPLRDSLRAVAEGRVDATLDARIIGLKYIRDDHLDNVEAADVALLDYANRLHIGVHRGDSIQLALINEGLARLRANGTYSLIYQKWIDPLDPQHVRLRQLQPYLVPVAGVIALIVGALFWQRRLLMRVKRQAAALRQSEERLMLVLEGSEDGFWDWDLRTGRIERSERWAAMLGYQLAEIPPTLEGGANLVHPDDRTAYDAFYSKLKVDDNRYNLEYRMHTRSGEWRWVMDRGKIVARAPDGTPQRMAGTHTDITNLKRTQMELTRQEAHFRFIYEHAPVGLSWVRRQEADTRLVNPAHERITGVPASRSHDTANYIAASHPDDRQRQHDLAERLYRGEIDSFSIEKRYLHPNNTVVWAMLTMHLFRDSVTGEMQELATLVDLTDVKKGETERENLRLKMIETQKLESLGVLAGGIAHDFNNLLTVILANATFARGGDADAGDREARLDHIEHAARRAADLCNQMLAYAGRSSFIVARVDLGALVRDTAQLLQVSISKKARLVLDLAPELPAVDGDLSQLRQIVMNLVINASEALAEAAGEIRIASRLARPAAARGEVIHSFDLPPGDCVCLEISDTGAGMNAATLARIFDPFFTTKFAGRGLGLAAVLGIVRTHHGALVVRSAPDAGTSFRLFLPATAHAATTPPAPAGAAAPRQPAIGTVLIADDEPAVLATTDALLRHRGYHTVLANDGNAAVQRFRANPHGFTAVLLDLTMPGLDGAQVLREIRLLNPAVRVLVMSGFSEQDVLNRLRGLGPVSTLHKPFTMQTLLTRLAEVAGV